MDKGRGAVIRRAPRRKSWTTLDNALIEDPKLSWRTLGVLTYLLSRPDNWEANVRHLASLRGEGDYAVRQALKEMESAGYLVRRRERDENGRWEWVQVIFECPSCEDAEAVDDPATMTRLSTHGESRGTANSHTANRRAAKIAPEEVIEVTSTEPTKSEPNGSRAPNLDWKLPDVVARSGFLDAALDLCSYWASRLEDRGVSVGKRARSKAWVAPMEAMLRIDERDPDRVRRCIDWLEGGAGKEARFWRKNILSPEKLRERWDQLVQAWKYEREGRSGRDHQSDASSVYAQAAQRLAGMEGS